MSRIGSSEFLDIYDENFDEISNECFGPEIFEYALKKLGHEDKRDVIMIGDSQTADVQEE